MPKIIENLPERLAEEARRQIEESGFAAMTIRSVAKSCGVGVGTVYNYYPSKEALVATFMLSDWKACIADIQNCADTAENAEAVLRAVSEKLQLFMKQYDPIFRDEAASGSYKLRVYYAAINWNLFVRRDLLLMYSVNRRFWR